jgi:VanZ family protein
MTPDIPPTRKLLHSARLFVAILFWPALVLVVWGSLAAFRGPILDLGVSVEDLILHFTAYGGLAGMAAIAWKERRRALLAVAALILMGVALEFIQSFAGRERSVADALAKCAGAALGFAIVRPIVEALRRRYDFLTQGREKTGS